jgi:uncharacterized oligopeptide transporter (OPT) family protein
VNDIIKNSFKKIKEEQARLRREMLEKTVGYIVVAMGLVAGLAWNDAVKTTIEYFFPLNSNTIFTKLIYAVFVTILVVLVTVYLVGLTEKKAEK